MKSLTMHCMSPWRCYKNSAAHFGGNKFAPSVDHIRLEYSQLKAFLCRPAPLRGEILCPAAAKLVAGASTLKHYSHDNQCSGDTVARLLWLHGHKVGFLHVTYQPRAASVLPKVSCGISPAFFQVPPERTSRASMQTWMTPAKLFQLFLKQSSAKEFRA